MKISETYDKTKSKISSFFKKTNQKFSKFIEKLDTKIDPKMGYFWYRFFTMFSRFLFLLVFPILIILISIDAYNTVLEQGFLELHQSAIITLAVLYVVVQFAVIIAKKYFLKWRRYPEFSSKNINSVSTKKINENLKNENSDLNKKPE